ncbi:hypothetical protein K474DRAFT_1674375 [Panus rudis PR-1116 ss-1]|nr:hypothetical protein K474DRAFT_1674375 [Panus rudis PR-1116 ss-1]
MLETRHCQRFGRRHHRVGRRRQQHRTTAPGPTLPIKQLFSHDNFDDDASIPGKRRHVELNERPTVHVVAVNNDTPNNGRRLPPQRLSNLPNFPQDDNDGDPPSTTGSIGYFFNSNDATDGTSRPKSTSAVDQLDLKIRQHDSARPSDRQVSGFPGVKGYACFDLSNIRRSGSSMPLKSSPFNTLGSAYKFTVGTRHMIHSTSGINLRSINSSTPSHITRSYRSSRTDMKPQTTQATANLETWVPGFPSKAQIQSHFRLVYPDRLAQDGMLNRSDWLTFGKYRASRLSRQGCRAILAVTCGSMPERFNVPDQSFNSQEQRTNDCAFPKPSMAVLRSFPDAHNVKQNGATEDKAYKVSPNVKKTPAKGSVLEFDANVPRSSKNVPRVAKMCLQQDEAHFHKTNANLTKVTPFSFAPMLTRQIPEREGLSICVFAEGNRRQEFGFAVQASPGIAKVTSVPLEIDRWRRTRRKKISTGLPRARGGSKRVVVYSRSCIVGKQEGWWWARRKNFDIDQDVEGDRDESKMKMKAKNISKGSNCTGPRTHERQHRFRRIFEVIKRVVVGKIFSLLSSSFYNEVGSRQTWIERRRTYRNVSTGRKSNELSRNLPDLRSYQEGGGGQDFFPVFPQVFTTKLDQDQLGSTVLEHQYDSGRNGREVNELAKGSVYNESWAKTDLDRMAQDLERKNVSRDRNSNELSRKWTRERVFWIFIAVKRVVVGKHIFLPQVFTTELRQEQLGSNERLQDLGLKNLSTVSSISVPSLADLALDRVFWIFVAIKRVVVGKVFFSSSNVYNEVAFKTNLDRNAQDLDRKNVSMGFRRIFEAIKRVVCLQRSWVKTNLDRTAQGLGSKNMSIICINTSTTRNVKRSRQLTHERVSRTFEAIKRVVMGKTRTKNDSRSRPKHQKRSARASTLILQTNQIREILKIRAPQSTSGRENLPVCEVRKQGNEPHTREAKHTSSRRKGEGEGLKEQSQHSTSSIYQLSGEGPSLTNHVSPRHHHSLTKSSNLQKTITSRSRILEDNKDEGVHVTGLTRSTLKFRKDARMADLEVSRTFW